MDVIVTIICKKGKGKKKKRERERERERDTENRDGKVGEILDSIVVDILTLIAGRMSK